MAYPTWPPPPPPRCPPPPPPPPRCPPPPPCDCYCPSPPPPPPRPPPPPILPPPPPPPLPPPPPPSGHTVYIAVFVSLGGLFFLAFLAAGLLFVAYKKRKERHDPGSDHVSETCIEEEEHRHVEEVITTGPCGEQTVTVTVDEDVRIHEIVESEDINRGHLSNG
ncbi:PREDICTED: glyceraldehyde-3-phosphate dehydrogenase, testis-specific-like [Tarenaya hassleriana]|uniref:glyceraldehyde-3-phosphate dehydrogenase, testis-specific-like n=1 Tax=Tarenaya hassleriana TaxID=28532 RepID=UPI00053C5D6A|nr:PREDICTED: glyceraldehyde-3-phosphate dehydrogenase, testis-specific-like [Tarenaya hassleriana]